MSHHHNNPILSILIGAIFSIIGGVTSETAVNLSLDLSRVIVFGLIGGASGYLGRLLIIALLKKIKTTK